MEKLNGKTQDYRAEANGREVVRFVFSAKVGGLFRTYLIVSCTSSCNN